MDYDASVSIVDDLGAPGKDTSYGHGLINALSAVRAASEIAVERFDLEPDLLHELADQGLLVGLAGFAAPADDIPQVAIGPTGSSPSHSYGRADRGGGFDQGAHVCASSRGFPGRKSGEF